MAPFTCISALVAVLSLIHVSHGSFSHGQLAVCRILARTCDADADPASILRGLESEPEVDNACRRLEETHRCLGDCLAVMMGGENDANALNKIIRYVCAPEQRESVIAITEMECFHDNSFHASFESVGVACLDNMMSTYSGYRAYTMMCDLVRDLVPCVTSKITEICGAGTEELFGGILKIGITEMSKGQLPDCFQQVAASHTVVRRAVEMIKAMKK